MDQRTSNDGDRRVLREEAQEHLEELQQRVGEINDRLVNFIKQRPATALLIAAGAGFLIGRILRS